MDWYDGGKSIDYLQVIALLSLEYVPTGPIHRTASSGPTNSRAIHDAALGKIPQIRLRQTIRAT